MGSYLATPVRDKHSEDSTGSNGLRIGTCEMQGWRISQEDAHLAVVNFDLEGRSMLYAVFDGHGGAEVAKYAAAHLGAHLKSLPAYKDGRYEEALEEAFLTFDASLKEPHVQKVLRALAKDDSDNEANASESSDDEDLEGLMDDADVPIDELAQRYPPAALQRLLAGRIDVGSILQAVAERVSAGSDSEDEEEEEVEDGDEKDDSVASDTDSQAEVSSSDEKTETGAGDGPKPSVKLEHLQEITGPAEGESAAEKVNGPSETHTDNSNHQKTNEDASKKASEEATTPASTDSAPQKETLPTEISIKKDVDGVKTTPGGATVSVHAETSVIVSVGNPPPVQWIRSRIIDDDAAETAAGSSSGASSSGADGEGESEAMDDDYDPRCDEEAEEGEDDDDEEEGDESIDPAIARRLLQGELFELGSGGSMPGFESGATACLALLVDNLLYVANVGDSRCVVACKGQAVEMSHDHKPEDAVETERIHRAGGKVTADGRVNNGLNLSRALGDHNYKRNETLPLAEQMISAKPDVRKLQLSTDHNFMIIACDGIWNSMDSQAAVQFVSERLAQPKERTLSNICEELFDSVLAPHSGGDGTGMDNMTCIIVQFPPEGLPPPPAPTNGIHSQEALSNGVGKRGAPDEAEAEAEGAPKKTRVDENGRDGDVALAPAVP